MSKITLPQLLDLIEMGHLSHINDHRGAIVDPVRASKMDFTREITARFFGDEIVGRYDPRDQAQPNLFEDFISDKTGKPRTIPRPTLEDIKQEALLKALNIHYATLSNHRRMEIQSLLAARAGSQTRKDTP